MELFSVIWRKYNEDEKIVIGYLIYDNKWYFKYNDKTIMTALKKGFRPFPDMPELTKAYESVNLFHIFNMRYYKLGNNLFIEDMKKSDASLVTDKILIKYLKNKYEGNM